MAFFIEHRIGVAAPPHVVWAILSDIEGWSEWTGLYRNASGALRIGERITAELVLPGESPETLQWTVLDWAPDMQIHLRVKLYGGLLTTTRYMEIDKLSETGCIFGNGEMFAGLAARFMPRRLKRAIRRAFEAMNEALKAKAEARWMAQRGEGG
jgi:hypothetical protein